MIKKQIQTVAVKELWNKDTEGYIPVLLEIYNPDIRWDDDSFEQENMYLRVVNDSNNVKYNGKKYLASSFSFKPPEQNGTKTSSATLTLSAIDSRVVQLLRSVSLVCEVTVVSAFAKTGSSYVFYPLDKYKLLMKSATYSRITAELSLCVDEVWTMNVPRDIATKDRFPSVNVNE